MRDTWTVTPMIPPSSERVSSASRSLASSAARSGGDGSARLRRRPRRGRAGRLVPGLSNTRHGAYPSTTIVSCPVVRLDALNRDHNVSTAVSPNTTSTTWPSAPNVSNPTRYSAKGTQTHNTPATASAPALNTALTAPPRGLHRCGTPADRRSAPRCHPSSLLLPHGRGMRPAALRPRDRP